MKKIIYLFIVALMGILFSCQEDLDNWYTETSSYDGRYVVASTCEEYSDDDTSIGDGNELMLYNSAANIENEIIIDTHIAGLPIKGKFSVTGNAMEFSATDVVSNISRSSELSDDDFYVLEDGIPVNYPSQLPTPQSASIERDGVQLYTKVSLEAGKIIPKAATTIGGNTSDSIYMQATLYSDLVTIESYELPQEEWTDPETPEYSWRVKDGSRTNADGWEEHWTLSGYRYTGFPEDRF